jgi:8-oxo-dGTP pyrophosphatase MutT (NUDIX family)
MKPLNEDPRLRALRARLRGRRRTTFPSAPGVRRAAVALVVRADPADLELLLIQRAMRPGDPWSGHMALPGGKQDAVDPDLRATAIRETREEVAVDLRSCGLELGPLDDVHTLGVPVPPLAISPYVFAVPSGTPARPNMEVEAALWIRIGDLAHPGARAEYLHAMDAERSIRFPALRHEGRIIWGLTYRMLTQFLEIAGVSAEPAS